MLASLVAQMVSICLQCGRPGFDPWAVKIPWKKAWRPTPVLTWKRSLDREAWWATVHRVTEELDMMK